MLISFHMARYELHKSEYKETNRQVTFTLRLIWY